MAKQKITIVGAGLGGLALGRCLHQRGIPAIIYDRNSSPPSYNYGITLHASAYRPLLKATGESESTFRSRVAVDAANGAITTAATGNHVEHDTCFRANRGALENWLRQHLDVQWGRGADTVEISSDNSPTNKRIVVGSDGVHSAVRRQLLPELELNILPFVVFNGKRRIDTTEYHANLAGHMRGSTVINFKHGDARLNFSLGGIEKSKASVSWTYSRPWHGVEDPLHKPDRALSQATAIPEALFDELKTFSQACLPRAFAQLFDETQVRTDRILHWLMRTVPVPQAEVLERWARQGIVLLGDAVHAHPIISGNGANMAIQDAVSLAEYIATIYGTSNIDLSEWIAQRHSSWLESVQAATQNIDSLHATPSQRL
ncbi:hypothetical protein ACEQ8H_003387 [Pleosporales sp. CAS-2024a]